MDINVLKDLNVLYVEDDDNVRSELAKLLSKLFSNLYLANNGINGLKKYKEHEKSIDIIISDINMPELNGIEMFKHIRKININVPIIFTTAYSDKEFLNEAIKLKVDDYIVKPIDVRALIDVITKIGKRIFNEKLLFKQNIELNNYKEALNTNNIILKTDSEFNITFVNEMFCKTTNYETKDLLNKNISFLRHKDTSFSIFEDILEEVNNHKSWSGIIKYISNNDNEFFIAQTYIMGIYADDSKLLETLCVLSDITAEVNKKRNIQKAMMKDKGDIFIKSKESSAESEVHLNELNEKITYYENEIKIITENNSEYKSTLLDMKSELKALNKDLVYYKKIANTNENTTSNISKANKENSLLRAEMKVLDAEVEKLSANSKVYIEEQKIKYEKKLEKLSFEVKEYRNSIGNIDVLNEKITYWKTKAKSEALRVESMEKRMIETKDESFLKKMFH